MQQHPTDAARFEALERRLANVEERVYYLRIAIDLLGEFVLGLTPPRTDLDREEGGE